jgi:hypothetical protein
MSEISISLSQKIRDRYRDASFKNRLWLGVILYVLNVLLGLDYFGAAILGLHPGITISRWMGMHLRKDRCWTCKVICWFLDRLDNEHCLDASEVWTDAQIKRWWKENDRSIWR